MTSGHVCAKTSRGRRRVNKLIHICKQGVAGFWGGGGGVQRWGAGTGGSRVGEGAGSARAAVT